MHEIVKKYSVVINLVILLSMLIGYFICWYKILSQTPIITDWVQGVTSIVSLIVGIVTLLYLYKNYQGLAEQISEQKRQTTNLENQLFIEKERFRIEMMPIFEFNYERGYKISERENQYCFELNNLGKHAFHLQLINKNPFEIQRNADGQNITTNKLYFFIDNTPEANKDFDFAIQYEDIIGNKYTQSFSKKAMYIYPNIPNLIKL